MSIHCLFCGHQSNWREEEDEDNYEVEVDDQTWVVIGIHNDPDMEHPDIPKRKHIEEIWAHRDCVQKWLENLGVDTKIKYKPKKIEI